MSNRTRPSEMSLEEEQREQYGEPYKFDANFRGPVQDRQCTDLPCLLIFVVFLIAWAGVAYVAVSQGDIDKVLYPTDSSGYLCGSGEMEGRPNLLFFDLSRCLNPAVVALGCPTPQICVEQCPDKRYSPFAALASGYSEITVKSKMRPYCAKMSDAEWEASSARKLIDEGKCPAWYLPSEAVLGRCLPRLSSDSKSSMVANITKEDNPEDKEISEKTLENARNSLAYFLGLRNVGEKVFNDLADTWWMVLSALVLCCVLSFLWIVLLRFFGGPMVWTSIFLFVAIFTALFGFTLVKYLQLKDLPSAEGNILMVNITPNYADDLLAQSNTWLFLSIVFGVILVVMVLVLIALRKRIAIAIELIEEASEAVGQHISAFAFPILPFLMHCVVFLFFVFVALGLSSSMDAEYKVVVKSSEDLTAMSRSGEAEAPPVNCPHCINEETNEVYRVGETCFPSSFNISCRNCDEARCQFTKYVDSKEASYMQWFNLFGLYWGMFFVTAIEELVLAGVFARWYWTWDKRDVPFFTLGISIFNTFFYHLGTAAFGSLVVAIIRMIRTIVSTIEEKAKRSQNEAGRLVLVMCKCCLSCLESFMRFINRNAFIVCAVKSTHFLQSARDAFNLLMRNILRVVVLDKVVGFVLFLGQCVVTGIVALLAYLFFSGGIAELREEIPTLNSYLTPILAIAIGCFVITSSFFSVYSMAVDTIFLCFLEDLERNDGTPSRPYFMSRGLQRVVGHMQKFNDEYRSQ